jgi:hypothetical protein
MFQFKAEPGPHDGQMCIQIRNPPEEIREIVKIIVGCSWIDSKEYKVSRKAGAFLQCDYKDYILVEFWKKDYQDFINFVNTQLKRLTECPNCGKKTLPGIYCMKCFNNF